MNVIGLVLRAVSTTYTTTVGNVDAKVSVIIEPEADQVKTSICPGVSKIAYLWWKTMSDVNKFNNYFFTQMKGTACFVISPQSL